MEDKHIIELFYGRCEQALTELDLKYGKLCHKLSYNILNSWEDAGECVNDSYLAVWTTIPPAMPDPLRAYLCKIVRNVSLKLYYYRSAAKRNSHYEIAMNELDDRYIEKAIQYEKKECLHSANRDKGISSRLKWIAAAACAALIIAISGLFSPVTPGMPVSAYAYGSEEKITESGAIISTGTINEDGEVTGHPLMFFLAGENIETVRFSCKNQIMNFIDLTEKRDGFGDAQNFTVNYGEDPNEYYFLLIDWIPSFTIQELSNNADRTITALSENLRNDIIVMEISFADGSKAAKAIQISLQEDGTFFAAFSDYGITEADTFVNRPDSPSRPEPETEQETPDT